MKTETERELDKLRGRRVLCAVSGGADSMCLLYLLYSSGIDVAAAHYEHGIRGEEALRDARFVESWCSERKIKCVVGHGAVPEYALEQHMTLEEAARRLRYEFLRDTAAALGCELIATAHNADDNAETLIFNLCRGTGAAGLRGIAPERDGICRPLLRLTRAEIESCLRENGVAHVEDSTNDDDGYTRNLIRHKVMPVLRQINPEFSAAAARAARLLRQDEDCLSAIAAEFVAREFDGESLKCEKLMALHPAIASRAVRLLCTGSLSETQVQRVLEICAGSELSWTDLPGQRLRVERGRLWLNEESAIELKSRELRAGESVALPEAGLELSVETAKYGKEINGLFKTYYIKYENINGTLLLTGRKPGDRLRLPGRGCTKSLKSLFAEAGYTRFMRESTPVLRDAEGVAAVYGFGIAERLSPNMGDQVLKIQFKEITGDNS